MAERITAHGFRATFRTWAEEVATFPHAVIEQAMGHQVGGKVERAYRRTDLLEKRRELMDAWARHCECGAARQLAHVQAAGLTRVARKRRISDNQRRAEIGRAADKREKPARFPASSDGRSRGLANAGRRVDASLACREVYRNTRWEQRLERAWMERSIRARGMRSGEVEPVELPAYEPGDIVRIDCRHSRLFSAPRDRWVPAYQNIEVRKADLERLVGEAEGVTPSASNQAPQSVSSEASARNLSPAELGRKGGIKSAEKAGRHALAAICERRRLASAQEESRAYAH